MIEFTVLFPLLFTTLYIFCDFSHRKNEKRSHPRPNHTASSDRIHTRRKNPNRVRERHLGGHPQRGRRGRHRFFRLWSWLHGRGEVRRNFYLLTN